MLTLEIAISKINTYHREKIRRVKQEGRN
jgi:hypothetical protein